mmetsp:Transcript_12982/g.29866  ORF Transcript_12982/g.29866 Transcript_12982/m.29866 type:complete len:549 (+) Transcript_12982:429-2075(+)
MSAAYQDVRRRLKEIVSLPEKEDGDANESLDKVFESLAAGSFRTTAIASETKKIEAPDENISPLLLACDKSSSPALQYLKSQLEAGVIPASDLVRCWGGPMDPSFCSNTPSHHAAASGLCDAVDVLHDFQTLLIEGKHGVTENCDPCRRFISLVTEGNQHGDTPLMMAAASGHTSVFRHVLSRSLELAMNEANSQGLDDCLEVARKALKSGLDMKNHEGCNAVNLACGHSHLDTVAFLVRSHEVRTGAAGKVVSICESGDEPEDDALRIDFGPLVDVSYTDVEFCKDTVENLEGGLAFMKQHKQDSRVREFEAQISQAKACLLILESEVERISLLAASDLLNANELQTSLEGQSRTNDVKGKPKKRKKKKKGESKANRNRPTDDESAKGCIDAKGQDERTPPSPPNRWKSAGRPREESSHVQPFVTLSDGRVVSRSSRTAECLPSPAPDAPAADGGDSAPGPGPDGAAGLRRILESTRGGGVGSDLESAMESLCLEPSMLLLSEHSLALEMSPCQLEQIEAILVHQTRAVGAARRIQRRMLDAKPAGE